MPPRAQARTRSATAAGSYERQARRTEAGLLFFVLLLFLSGAYLVLRAKELSLARSGIVLLNTAPPEAIARALRSPVVIGKRIVAERRLRGLFGDVDALGRLPVLPDPDAAARKLAAARLSPRTATRSEIAGALGPGGVDAPTLERLVVLRELHPEDSWQRLARRALLSPARVRNAEAGLVVRTWAEARSAFVRLCGWLALFFVAVHLVLRRLRPRADPFLLPLTALLAILGVLLLFGQKDPVRDMPTYAAQGWAVILGGGPMLLLPLLGWFGRLPLHRYGYLYAIAALAGTVALGLFGSGPGGVRLSVAGTQPVEAIKVLLVFFLAAYLAERGPLLNDPLRRLGPFPLPRRKDAGPLLVLYALPLVLFALVRDLGPVLLLFGTFLLLVYLATGRGVYVGLGLLALGLGGWMGYQMRFGVFETRVDMWLSPWANRHQGGDQLGLGLWGMASGGAWGSGLGLGAPGEIPRGGSDLMFAALGEELGLAGTLLVIACFLVILARGLRTARRAGSDFDRLLAAGLCGLLALQASLIVGGTVGVLPLAGITLPFVSYGKSSLVASFFVIGMLLLLSARAPAAALGPPRTYEVAAARVALLFTLFLVGVVGAGRLLWIQGLAASRVAGQTLRVPDADGVARPHVNPRLLRLAARIPRGRILDRMGRVLAETRGDGRIYPYGAVTGHLVGYLDPAVGGPTGLERRLNARLRGFEDWPSLVPLWRRKDMPGFRLPRGEDISLALDAELQKQALAALVREAGRVRDRRTGRPKNRGAVVVLDVETGGVLAAATSPVFNPNGLTPAAFRALQLNVGGDFPLIDRALFGRYPPGSTFKIVTASTLFAQNRADFTRTCAHIDRNVIWRAGGQTYARQRIVDDEGETPHGLVNLTEGIVESCNIYFAHAGLALGPEALRAGAAQFGFARLPGSAPFAAELPDIAYGQGPMLASPIEMAGVALSVAAGGRRLRPEILKRDEPRVAATPLAPEDAARLADMMRRVTVSGTAAGRFDELPYGVAGKTGTAQNREGDKMSHSWFIGFAPVTRPKIAFAVIVENGGYGASVAVPIARQVLRAARL